MLLHLQKQQWVTQEETLPVKQIKKKCWRLPSDVPVFKELIK